MAWSPDYCTSAELKAYRHIEDAVDDAQIGLVITAASRAVDRFCDRQFGSAVQTRRYTPRWDKSLCRWAIDVDDVMTVVGLEVDYDSAGDGTYSTAVTDFELYPQNAAADGRPWSKVVVKSGAGSQRVEVTATFGWTAVPTPVKTATLLQASRFLVRRDAPLGIAGSDDSQIRLLDRVDPDVAAILRPYRKVWGAA
jgi:hypothetical protein